MIKIFKFFGFFPVTVFFTLVKIVKHGEFESVGSLECFIFYFLSPFYYQVRINTEPVTAGAYPTVYVRILYTYMYLEQKTEKNRFLCT